MASFLPELKKNETLYGWACRFHLLSGNYWPASTGRYLFGDTHSAFRLDFPTRLEYFSNVTDMAFGSAENLAMSHSTLSAYSPFMSHEELRAIIKYMKSGTLKNLKDKLGVTANKTGVFCGLKACPECISEDIEKEFTSTWHLDHQMPATWICLEHGQLLKLVRRELHTVMNKKFVRPHEVHKDGWEIQNRIPDSTLRNLAKIAEFVDYFSNHFELPFDSRLLRYTFLFGISNNGLIKMNASVKDELWWIFKHYYRGLEEISGVNIAKLDQELQIYIFNLLGKYEYPPRPIIFYLFMAFLFESPRDFITAYGLVFGANRMGGSSGVAELIRNNILARNRPRFGMDKYCAN